MASHFQKMQESDLCLSAIRQPLFTWQRLGVKAFSTNGDTEYKLLSAQYYEPFSRCDRHSSGRYRLSPSLSAKDRNVFLQHGYVANDLDRADAEVTCCQNEADDRTRDPNLH